MRTLRICNKFGITPTNTYQSAGMDFYVPNVDPKNEEQAKAAYEAFKKSYKVTDEQLNSLMMDIRECLMANVFERHIINILHLYLAFYDVKLEMNKLTVPQLKTYVKSPIYNFINNYLTFDDNGTPGVIMPLNSSLFINSGIKIALDPDTAGIFLNKSGKGNAGYDVRAQVVDEDYSGYVHLSMAMTKEYVNEGKNIVFCGDKLTQMVIVPVYHSDIIEIDENEYNNIMKDSSRGDAAFGHSDVKH